MTAVHKQLTHVQSSLAAGIRQPQALITPRSIEGNGTNNGAGVDDDFCRFLPQLWQEVFSDQIGAHGVDPIHLHVVFS